MTYRPVPATVSWVALLHIAPDPSSAALGVMTTPDWSQAPRDAARRLPWPPLPATPEAAPGRYSDGRTIPREGDEVYTIRPATLGMVATLHGRVERWGQSLRVIPTRPARTLLGDVKMAQSYDLTADWTIEGEVHPRDHAQQNEAEQRNSEARRSRQGRARADAITQETLAQLVQLGHKPLVDVLAQHGYSAGLRGLRLIDARHTEPAILIEAEHGRSQWAPSIVASRLSDPHSASTANPADFAVAADMPVGFDWAEIQGRPEGPHAERIAAKTTRRPLGNPEKMGWFYDGIQPERWGEIRATAWPDHTEDQRARPDYYKALRENYDSISASNEPPIVIENADGVLVGVWDGWRRARIARDEGWYLPALIGRFRRPSNPPPTAELRGFRGVAFLANLAGSAKQFIDLTSARKAAEDLGPLWGVYGNQPYYVGYRWG